MPTNTKLLTQDQINIINVYMVEMPSDTDKPDARKTDPGVAKLASRVVDKLFSDPKYREDQAFEPFLHQRGKAEFRKLKGWEQLQLLFDLQAREFYPDVRVNKDPPALQAFRQKFHPRYVVG
ncbi:MAG: hypothetical protein IIA67_07865, partial [Planctomycetes bacterium]|nr:hypothetical protein [Planctomycetota bacterium]